MRWVHDIQTVTLEAAGGDDTQLVTMARQDRAFRELTIWGEPGTGRVVGDAADVRDFTTRVYFGPTPQGAATARSDDEIYFIFDPGDTVRLWPANEPSSNKNRSPRDQVRGFDISVLVVNLDAAPLVLTIEFLALTIENG